MSNEKGGYVLIDINPLVGPDSVVEDADIASGKYAFEILQKIKTGVMPVCTKLGDTGITFKTKTPANYTTGTFQMPVIRVNESETSHIMFTGFQLPFSGKTCLAVLSLTPSPLVDKNGNPREEATAVWHVYENA